MEQILKFQEIGNTDKAINMREILGIKKRRKLNSTIYETEQKNLALRSLLKLLN